jgi:hypothetical protein
LREELLGEYEKGKLFFADGRSKEVVEGFIDSGRVG